jgi:SM-20-related protein
MLNTMDEFVLNPLYEKVINGLMEQRYSIVDEFFTKEEVAGLRTTLIRRYDEDQFNKSAIGNQSNEKIIDAVRGDFILWLDEANAEDAERNFFNKLSEFTQYLNRTCFMGIVKQEFHYAVYPEGTFYKRHLDTFMNDSSRKLSVVCYLNDEDWKPEYGGELTLYTEENGKQVSKDVYPLQGRLVVFESQVLEHEVKPVNKKRLSITGWLKTRGN